MSSFLWLIDVPTGIFETGLIGGSEVVSIGLLRRKQGGGGNLVGIPGKFEIDLFRS